MSDPVSRLELRRRGDDELLALVHAASADAGPAARETARLAWNELLERDVDRVRALVSVWRLPGSIDARPAGWRHPLPASRVGLDRVAIRTAGQRHRRD